MFAHPIWSVLVLVAVFALYWFVIRPKAPFLETRTNVENWFARQWARIVAFRSYVATAIAAALVALPDIVVAITPADLSNLIGPDYAKYIMSGLAVFLAVNRAFSTKPGNEKP